MGDAMRKVKPTHPLVISAAQYNTFMDASQDCLRRGQGHRQEAHGRNPVDGRPRGLYLPDSLCGTAGRGCITGWVPPRHKRSTP